MDGVLARIRSVFVEAPPRPVVSAVVSSALPSVGLLADETATVPLASLIGHQLAVAHRSKLALVCVLGGEVRGGDQSFGMPAVSDAKRLAASLLERDLQVRAVGRIVRVTLRSNCQEAVRQIAQLTASARYPSVVAVTGPRTEMVDRILAERDLLLVAGATAGEQATVQTKLAYESLKILGPPVQSVTCRLSLLERLCSQAGFVFYGGARSSLKPCLAQVL